MVKGDATIYVISPKLITLYYSFASKSAMLTLLLCALCGDTLVSMKLLARNFERLLIVPGRLLERTLL